MKDVKLTDMLATMERPAARRSGSKFFRRSCMKPLRGLCAPVEPNASVVRDMLSIIHRIDPPDRASLFAAGCPEHPNLMVRPRGFKILPGRRSLKHQCYIGEDACRCRDAGAHRGPSRAGGSTRASLLALHAPHAVVGLFRAGPASSAIASARGSARDADQSRVHFRPACLSSALVLFSRARVNEAAMALVGLQPFGTIEVSSSAGGRGSNASIRRYYAVGLKRPRFASASD